MLELPWVTWVRFVIWLGVGLLIYLLYGIRRSRIGKGEKAKALGK